MADLAIKPVSATDAVVASLRERILDGTIDPGVRLPEVDLAADYGVARPTVRAAIQTLCHEGLLQRERNRSAVVPRLGEAEIADLFSVRVPLECLIVRRLLERRGSLDDAHRATDELEALSEDTRWSAVVDADLGFHHALAHAAGSPRLERLYGSLRGEIQLCVAQLRPAWSTVASISAEHRELLDVIESRDVELAEARMTSHLTRAIHDLTGEPPA